MVHVLNMGECAGPQAAHDLYRTPVGMNKAYLRELGFYLGNPLGFFFAF